MCDLIKFGPCLIGLYNYVFRHICLRHYPRTCIMAEPDVDMVKVAE